jgi:predicted ferric reductase
VGTEAEIEGPFGKFSNPLQDKAQIWIAGGIGITPFLSMARSLTGSEPQIDLYYCFKEQSEAVFVEELHHLAKIHHNFRVIPFCSSTQGRIDVSFLEKESKGLNGKEIFICGPITMIHSLSSSLNKQHVHMEEFELL